MTYNFTDRRLLRTPMPDAQLSSIESLTSLDQDNVATPSLSYQRMRVYWDVIDAVRGGTFKIRELNEAFLPKEPGEGKESYRRRLGRVILSPWYTRLVRGLVGMVLRKPVRLENQTLRERDWQTLLSHLDDVNLQGDNLQTFVKSVFESAIDYNYAGILIEYPNTEGVTSQADELQLGIRPYWVLYPATEILGLRWRQQGSQRQLTQVRLKQQISEQVGEFGEAEIDQVLVYDLVDSPDGERVRWRIFREVEDEGSKNKKTWAVYSSGVLSLAEIPFVLCYTDKNCRLELPPPLLEVAYLNLRHFQLTADLDHALHVASLPRLFIFGVAPEEIGAIDSIDEAICVPRAEARVDWLSANLESFAPLQSRISEIEQQMSVLGLSTIVTPKNVGESAEAKRLDRTQGDSMIAVVAQSLQNALNGCLYFHLKYLGIQGEASCQVNRDFDVIPLDPQTLTALYQIRQGGDLTQETFLELLKQSEIGLPDDWNPAREIEKLEASRAAQMAAVEPDIEDVSDFQP